jgi:uncharacterized protein
MRRREISRAECLDLLAQADLGRVAFVNGALPEVIPVCYTVAGDTVVFGVHSASPLARQMEGSVVAFQADSFDAQRKCGWQVRAIGSYRSAVSPDELAVAGAVVPQPWTIGEVLELVVQLDLEVVGGWVIEASDVE